MSVTDPTTWPGRLLQGSTASWHLAEGAVSADPVHVWLDVEGLGSIRLHTSGDGSLELSAAEAGDDVDMGELGRIQVRPSSPDVLMRVVGKRIESVGRLRQQPTGQTVGWVMSFGDLQIGMANLWDELTIAPWPGARWEESEVTRA